jgi:sugar/nucleoside kinase (ribokinase family)
MLIDVSTMIQQNKFDIVTVGHFAIDTISSRETAHARTTLGGSATYASVAAARLGARISVISKVGKDFPAEYRNWLQRNNIDLSGLRQAETGVTTRFSLKYQATWERKLQLKARAPSITASDIPDSLQVRAIHVAPIANELPIDAIIKLRKSAPILSIDPQGFVRDFSRRGIARLKSWTDPSLMKLSDVYKSSSDEIRMVTGTTNIRQAARKILDYGAKVVVVTQGMRGSTLLFDEDFFKLSSYSPRKLVDPTGAGDAYIGAFLAEYIRSKDPLWCACVGSASASFVVEDIGPSGFGGREETYARAREIYEKRIC